MALVTVKEGGKEGADYATLELAINASEAEIELTLQAIYAENTAQALADAAAVEAPTKIPLLMPGEPPEPERTLKDFDSSIRAYENRAVSGDRFLDSLYEYT